MTHWGWFWKIKKKHIAKKLCSKQTKIDSFEIYKNGISRGFRLYPLEISANPIQGHLQITYRKQKSSPYTIPIEQLTCHYGGIRTYFLCPLCKKRMRFLYLAENSIFLCRRCLNLGYKSQRMRPTNRYEYMAKKMKTEIFKNQLYQKPKGMRYCTYATLFNKQKQYELLSRTALNKDLLSWYGSKAMPFLVDESL